MKKLILLFSLLLFISCENYGQLQVKTKLPKVLVEVSGIQYSEKENAFWMLNDSGNKSRLYLVSEKGIIQREVKINAKNTDWEDITKDAKGNIYIADFGNNGNDREDLKILKVTPQDLLKNKQVDVEKITFSYPEQKKFPPKKKHFFFDAEALFWLNGYLYVFTKSHVKKKIGKTSLYRIPAIKGNYKAEFVSEFSSGNEAEDWITSADISTDGKKVVLLTHNAVWVFTNFKGDNFFSGLSMKLLLNHNSQKESITFKNDSTLYITDERSRGKGGNLYEFKLN